jgi:hypothetical protein
VPRVRLVARSAPGLRPFLGTFPPSGTLWDAMGLLEDPYSTLLFPSSAIAQVTYLHSLNHDIDNSPLSFVLYFAEQLY